MITILFGLLMFILGMGAGFGLGVYLLSKMAKLNLLMITKDGKDPLAITGRTFKTAVEQTMSQRRKNGYVDDDAPVDTTE